MNVVKFLNSQLIRQFSVQAEHPKSPPTSLRHGFLSHFSIISTQKTANLSARSPQYSPPRILHCSRVSLSNSNSKSSTNPFQEQHNTLRHLVASSYTHPHTSFTPFHYPQSANLCSANSHSLPFIDTRIPPIYHHHGA